MKKKLLIILLGLACVSMVGCGSKKKTTAEKTTETDGFRDIIVQEVVIQELYIDENIFTEDIFTENIIEEQKHGK